MGGVPGGLAAVQSYCTGPRSLPGNTDSLTSVYTFSADVVGCGNLFRYHWFIMAFEIVVITGAIIAAATPYGIPRSRGFWVGMFAVSTVLYMMMSEAFLAGISANRGTGGRNLSAFRTAAAGAIMTVVANIFCMFAIGSDWSGRGARAGKEEAGERPTGGGGTPAGMAAV